jgi:hypothetical protein
MITANWATKKAILRMYLEDAGPAFILNPQVKK